MRLGVTRAVGYLCCVGALVFAACADRAHADWRDRHRNSGQCERDGQRGSDAAACVR